MSTLVFFHGALGDTVLLWPLLRALAPLTLVGPGGAGRLTEREVAGVRTIEDGTPEWSRLFAEEQGAAEDLRAPVALQRTERIVSFVSDGRDAWARNTRRLRPDCPCWFARSRPPDGSTIHVTEYRLAQLERAGLRVQPRPGRRTAPPSAVTEPLTATRRPVVLAPGSGAAAKCWPAERFEQLAQGLLDRGLDVRILLGHVEQERLDGSVRGRWQARFHVTAPPTPLALADEIRSARMFVGNDSGPTHLAAQLGVPTLALFGPTDPRVWSPLGSDVHVVAPPSPRPIDWLDLASVARLVLQRLSPA